MDKSAMIRGGILSMQIDNKAKTELLEYLNELENDSQFLCCLQNVGVDNWNGYEDAIDMMEREEW